MPRPDIITIQSKHSVAITIDRLAAFAVSKGLLIFARIDHGQSGVDIGIPLRPTQLLIFGSPNLGTPLMQDQQVAGVDLPIRALAWRDEGDRVWLSYYPGSAIAAQHGLGAASQTAVDAMDRAISMLCALAVGQDLV